ncbi:MAG: PAS domain S-box protein [Caldimonas sp.]
MNDARPFAIGSALPDSTFRIIARACFLGAAVTSLGAAAIVALSTPALTSNARLWLVGALVLYAALALYTRGRGAHRSGALQPSLYAASLGAMLLTAAAALTLHGGLRDPALGVLGLIVCVISAVSSLRAGIVMAACAIAEIVLLAFVESRNPGAAAFGAGEPLLMLLLRCLVVGSGLAAGTLIARVISHYVRAAEERAGQASDLLRLAADWYWEQDRDHRFTQVIDASGRMDSALVDLRLGKTTWELSGSGLDEAQLDAHRADLEAHRSFAGLIMRGRDVDGRARVHSVSGRPRFTPEGIFDGYWGVGQDVTDEMRTQRAFAASETRYRELFERSPSPLFLHRHGVIFDANPSAARLFGFVDAEAMRGTRVVDLHPTGESRQRVEERIQRLERMNVGDGVPVSDFQAHRIDGKRINVQATGVRVDSVGGPATLTILFDITARLAAEAALRRSEAMLSHLFATSPDCITLSEIESGRHTMVNAAFSQLTGYAENEVVGRSATELGLWHDLRDRDRLRAAMESGDRIAEMPASIATRSGRVASVLISAARFSMAGRAYMVVNARDVTLSERTRLEHAAIFERASIGIALTRNRRFVHANPHFEAVFGWSTGSLIGQPGAAVWTDDDDYAEIGRLAGPLLSAGQPFETEREMKKQDGSRFWCRLLGQAVDPDHPGGGGTIWIADDVTERRRLDAALAAARDAAEAASRAKSAFLANTSHEIRTPLNALLGLARLALSETIDAPTRNHYLEQILASAQGLEGILTDILDFSKIEAGKFTIESSPFDLRALLVAVQASYRPPADARGLTLDLRVDERLATIVMGDPVRIRQILGNFVSNAVKFTARGNVCIEAAPGASGGVRLAVVDTGAGIEPELLRLLFQPFSQGDTSTTRRFGGTGLGLSICRQLAELMGGQAGVESRPGAGSTFWAELPLPPAMLQGELLSSEASDNERLQHARVLLVEDNPVNMMIAAATLTQWGVEVSEARDGRMAIEAVREAARSGRPFDLVLMDVQMPVMGGHEAAIELRKAWGPRALPIIALTAAALVSERDLALAAGMNDFLTKPIDPPKLRRTLAQHVRKEPGKQPVDAG